jgi:hypothetical protein
MAFSNTEFGELVTLLERSAPEELERLKRAYPQARAELRPGGVLGDSNLEIGCKVAQAALVEYSNDASKLLPKLRKRLARSQMFDLIAKVIAAAGSTGTLAALSFGTVDMRTTIAAAVAFAGSVCSILFASLQKDIASGSVSDAYNRLITALVGASELMRTLPVLCSAGETEELKAALSKANQTATILNELTFRYK